jgi:hypothetical protein
VDNVTSLRFQGARAAKHFKGGFSAQSLHAPSQSERMRGGESGCHRLSLPRSGKLPIIEGIQASEKVGNESGQGALPASRDGSLTSKRVPIS